MKIETGIKAGSVVDQAQHALEQAGAQAVHFVKTAGAQARSVTHPIAGAWNSLTARLG